MIAIALLLQAVAPGAVFSAASPTLITRADATLVAQTAITICEAAGEKVTVFVTDADGHLRAGLSADGAAAAGFRSAPLKTAAVLAFRVSTRALQTRAASDAAFAKQFADDPRYMFHPGGLPLYRAGRFIAVLAVGGGHDKDEGCALEALKRLASVSTAP